MPPLLAPAVIRPRRTRNVTVIPVLVDRLRDQIFVAAEKRLVSAGPDRRQGTDDDVIEGS